METPQNKERQGLRITRVYTKIGDAGTTQLCGGKVVPKNHPRLEAYGTVDELQTVIAAARDALADLSEGNLPPIARLIDHLIYIQNLLFTLGGDLATPTQDRWPQMPLIEEKDIGYLERLIDVCNAELPPLKDFVLPGGHRAVTALHHCRVVCRRAERAIEALAQTDPIGPPVRPFVNRLSDTFFVLARFTDARLREAGLTPPETIWRRDLPEPPLPSA